MSERPEALRRGAEAVRTLRQRAAPWVETIAALDLSRCDRISVATGEPAMTVLLDPARADRNLNEYLALEDDLLDRIGPVSYVDLRKRRIAPAELRRFVERLGARALLDESSKAYRDGGLAYLRMDDAEIVERLLADTRLLKLPLVRYGEAVTADFLHMQHECPWPVGASLDPDNVLGYSGNTGTLSRGPHLHWTVRVNLQTVDPLLNLASGPVAKSAAMIDTWRQRAVMEWVLLSTRPPARRRSRCLLPSSKLFFTALPRQTKAVRVPGTCCRSTATGRLSPPPCWNGGAGTQRPDD